MSGKLLLGSVALALTISVALAGAPVDNISGHKHPNLAAAQRLSTQAYEKISQAQQANEWDMGGHAAKAKELLDQVNRELKEAAEVANHRWSVTRVQRPGRMSGRCREAQPSVTASERTHRQRYAFFADGYAFSRLDASFALGLYCLTELIAAAAGTGRAAGVTATHETPQARSSESGGWRTGGALAPLPQSS